jgi:hypothetical protein
MVVWLVGATAERKAVSLAVVKAGVLVAYLVEQTAALSD